MNVAQNTWFANFPTTPGNAYSNNNAKMIAIKENGDVSDVNINHNKGMTVRELGIYYITGIVIKN